MIDPGRRAPGRRHVFLAAAALIVGSPVLTACSTSSDPGTTTGGAVIRVVAAENEYGNVAGQIGGRYVNVTSVESNPNTDPHTLSLIHI